MTADTYPPLRPDNRMLFRTRRSASRPLAHRHHPRPVAARLPHNESRALRNIQRVTPSVCFNLRGSGRHAAWTISRARSAELSHTRELGLKGEVFDVSSIHFPTLPSPRQTARPTCPQASHSRRRLHKPRRSARSRVRPLSIIWIGAGQPSASRYGPHLDLYKGVV